MTREEVLAEMETSFNNDLTEPDRHTPLFEKDGKEWTPAMLLEEVRNSTEIGNWYVQQWSSYQEHLTALQPVREMLTKLLSGDLSVLDELPDTEPEEETDPRKLN
jgi:hypothetical protein